MSVGYNLFGCMSLLTYRQDPYDVVSAGNYQIYSCGKQAELVRALLEQTYNLLREASASLQDSDAVHGLVYRTFLDGVDKHELRRMLAQIMAGEHVSIFGKPPWFPVIACVNNDNPRLKEPYEFCAKNLETPAIVRGTQFSTTMLATNRFVILTHELLHLYMGTQSLYPKVYEINACTGLPPWEAAINPANYEYYLAFVAAGCKLFPHARFHAPGRALGEDASKYFSKDVFKFGDDSQNDVRGVFGQC
ncbi:hypothetical protein MMC14_005070 [Varicellaria rhodocarpa]|nr:hypothetical protein [Varicellaria rhodocarpa]